MSAKVRLFTMAIREVDRQRLNELAASRKCAKAEVVRELLERAVREELQERERELQCA